MLDDSFWLANCDCPDRGKDWCLILSFFKKLCLSIWSRCFQNVGHSKRAYTKLMFQAFFLLFLFHNLVEEYLQGNLKSMLLLYETRWLCSESAPSTFIHNTIVTWRQDPHRFFPNSLITVSLFVWIRLHVTSILTGWVQWKSWMMTISWVQRTPLIFLSARRTGEGNVKSFSI